MDFPLREQEGHELRSMLLAGIVFLAIAVLVIAFVLPLREGKSDGFTWQFVNPGDEIVLFDEVTLRNLGSLSWGNPILVGYRTNPSGAPGSEEIELAFKRNEQEASLEVEFNFEEFGFQPHLKGASLSIGEQNKVLITIYPQTDREEDLTVTLRRKNQNK